ncbi:MAG: hypothetical protein J6V44_05995 [Methanobrevibacter sp.]|nr:hypothetical protein [Methanobrevibacter sp.]MBO7692803.1 hypothetical protein [Methanobrevibacter sp.]
MNNTNDQIKNCKQEKKKLEEQLLILEGVNELFRKARMNYISLEMAVANQLEDIKAKMFSLDKEIEILETMEDKK